MKKMTTKLRATLWSDTPPRQMEKLQKGAWSSFLKCGARLIKKDQISTRLRLLDSSISTTNRIIQDKVNHNGYILSAKKYIDAFRELTPIE